MHRYKFDKNKKKNEILCLKDIELTHILFSDHTTKIYRDKRLKSE